MKTYFTLRQINPEDAFRMVDFDFDGNINKSDLTEFLLRVLLVPKREINPPRIDRVFKLLDSYKRGYVQLEDFKKLFIENLPVMPTMTITNGFSKTFPTFFFTFLGHDH